MVDNPQADSPAAKAGIEAGDVITAVNGTDVKDLRDLARNISMMAPGSQVKLDILHKGKAKTVDCSRLAKCRTTVRPRPVGKHARGNRRHCRISGCSSPRRAKSMAPADKGVVVTAVDPDGPAAEHGVKTGDVILNVGGKAVANVGDVRSALSDAKCQRQAQRADAGEDR